MVNVRKAIEGDLVRVVELSELWASECIAYGLRANTEEILRGCIGDYFWVAEVDSIVVGYIIGTIRESDGMAVVDKGERYLEVDEVYVHTDLRNEKIGHLMVDKLLHTAESNGVRRSIVYSASKQWQEIVGFYEKHGFVQMYR